MKNFLEGISDIIFEKYIEQILQKMSAKNFFITIFSFDIFHGIC